MRENYDKGVSVMGVLVENVFPVGVTNELLDAVTDEMGVDAKIPPGGIVHVHFEKDGRAHGVDVWDSVEAYQQFVESTLMPAMGRLLQQEASIHPRWAGPKRRSPRSIASFANDEPTFLGHAYIWRPGHLSVIDDGRYFGISVVSVSTSVL